MMSYENDNHRVMASNEESPSPGPVGEGPGRMLHEIRELVIDHLELATLEAQLSANTLFRMAIVSIVTSLVLVSSWLALMGAAALALMSAGLSPELAMLMVCGCNLLIAITGWLWIRHKSHRLGWPATLRAIRRPLNEAKMQGGV